MMKRTTMAWSAREWLGAAALVAAVFLAYGPVWQAGFVWDDHLCVEHNPYLTDWRGLKAIWTSNVADIGPLTFTTFWLEHALWGQAALPYHLVNVALHGACAVVLWRVLILLRVPSPGAWLGTALWTLHPVNVESVAWIMEMKNTESGLFFLLAILFFLRWLQRGVEDDFWTYSTSLLFATLAMATKSSTVILPGVLCLAAWWLEDRWDWRNLRKVAPMLVPAAMASALSIWMQSLVLATPGDPGLVRTMPERVAAAGSAVWFYLGKLAWPHPMATAYPRWQIDPSHAAAWLPLLAVVATFVILWLKRTSWVRAPFFVFAYFLGALLPVLGLFDNVIFQYSIVFDHFQYLASMGPLALVGAALAKWGDRAKSWGLGVAAVLLAIFGSLSWQRAETFRSEETLWADTVAKYSGSWTAQYNLAVELGKQHRDDEAKIHLQRTTELYPHYANAYLTLAGLLRDEGHADAALAEINKVLGFNPKSADAYTVMGWTLLKAGRQDEALAAFKRATELDPQLAKAAGSYGQLLLQRGEVDAAIVQLRNALNLDIGIPDVYYDLGMAYLQKGQVDFAIIGFQKSLELDPANVQAHDNLGRALVQKGQLDAGVVQYQQALALDPKSAATESNLGVALFQAGLRGEAMKHLRKSLELDPNSDEANNNLGNALLATAQPNEAIAQYQKALAINPAFSDARRNLAVAYLYTGRPVEAITQLQQVIKDHPTDSVSQGLLTKAQELAKQKPAAK